MYKIFTKKNKFFHLLIIAMFMLALNACGYKSAPFYLDEVVHSDENIEIKQKN